MNVKSASATGHCVTCRHWRQGRTEWRVMIPLRPLPGEHPFTEATEERQDAAEARHGTCLKVDMLDYPVDADNVPVAFIRSAGDHEATVYTRDDFGCTLWEATDDGETS